MVAFIGDGALTGGMAWEALNNIAAEEDLPLVIVVNDNGRSYTPTVGGLAKYLSGLRTNPRYEQILDVVKRNVSRAPLVGAGAYELLHGIKTGLKDVLAPQGMFADLGLKYVGPIDGHDIAAVIATTRSSVLPNLSSSSENTSVSVWPATPPTVSPVSASILPMVWKRSSSLSSAALKPSPLRVTQCTSTGPPNCRACCSARSMAAMS